jgi:phosphoribosylformylglycinamidine synthase
MPTVIVVAGYGLNCEAETLFAFEQSKINGKIVHINEILKNPKILDNYQILAIPGGFSYGDQTGSGNAFASKMSRFFDNLQEFLNKDKLVIGICNGAQILTRFFTDLQFTFVANDSNLYQCEWVDLAVEKTSCIWLQDIDEIRLPIAHGEGKLYTENLQKIKNLVALRYLNNLNGSMDNIAALTDTTGKMLITMPHPERAIFMHHQDNFFKTREYNRRNNITNEKFSSAIRVFQNAYSYFC